MVSAGFKASVEDVDYETLQTMKRRLGIEPQLAGCHTTRIGDYFVEGHVPAEDIRRLLKETPVARGLAAPGMPLGSPGMDIGGGGVSYDVFMVLMDGETLVFGIHG